jgi:TRAP-type uncharacterized transport system substrate-binding protein
MQTDRKISLTQIQSTFMETFGIGRTASLIAIVLIVVVTVFAAYWFFHSAPPDTVTITSGPAGSIFQMNAEKYRKILARNGVKLKILPSQGSQENLKRLANPSFHVDIGFVQGGVTGGLKIDDLVSLGSISHQPILVFYRSNDPIDLLSQLTGRRLAIGPEGSGTRTIALTLLAANGIEQGGVTKLTDLEADEAVKALTEGKVDSVFMMGESASVQNMRTLLQADGVNLFDFTQADGYTRRINYLNKLELPKGSIDLGRNIPSHDITLIGPTVELIARPNLHPALSDLLIEAAQEVHGKAGLLQRRGEFPSPMEQEIAISADANRYYKSGKSFLYRYLPFWVASLVSRTLVMVVPIIVVLIPGLRFIPMVFRWRIRLRIFRWYRALLALEEDLVVELSAEVREALLTRLDKIDEAVNKMKVPASYADQFYELRGHIAFVRSRLSDHAQRN